MKKFKNSLNEFDVIFEILELASNQPKDYIYDKCAELRRPIQLDTEKTIADIKVKNNININTNESELDSSSLLIVDVNLTIIFNPDSIQKHRSPLIHLAICMSLGVDFNHKNIKTK